MKKILKRELIESFRVHLYKEEKSEITIEKYFRDVCAFATFAGEKEIEKVVVIKYKEELKKKGYATSSINSMLASVNAFFRFMEWEECKVKGLKTQKEIFCDAEKELSKEEYKRLLESAEKKPRLKMILQTICSTGIRVSELIYFTVEAVKRGEITVSCKNKIRVILLPKKLRRLLLQYVATEKINSGLIFRTKNGLPVNRSNIWTEMKMLCEKANVNPTKVFPHNLRKLFAKTFYKLEKDIVVLADILGHTSINTTRIYLKTSGKEHRKKIERLGLLE